MIVNGIIANLKMVVLELIIVLRGNYKKNLNFIATNIKYEDLWP